MATLVGIAGNDAAGPDRSSRAAGKSRSCSRILGGHGRVIVAYLRRHRLRIPGVGRDQVLGENAVAITADSASIPESHKRDAEAFARAIRIRHEYIPTYEFDNPDYVKKRPEPLLPLQGRTFHRLEEVGASAGSSISSTA